MSNKLAVIIGGTKGIGKAVALQLAQKHYDIIFVGRDANAGKTLEQQLNGYGVKATFLQGDLALMAESRRVAQEIAQLAPKIDLLIQTADVLRFDRENTSEGQEISFAINYLSRFIINQLLMVSLKAGNAKILHIAAAGSPFTLKPENFPPPASANGFSGHGIGQGANDIYGIEMAERLKGTGITINILNPGAVDTDIRRNMPLRSWQKVLMPVMMFVMATIFRMKMTQPDDYARIVVDLATNPAHQTMNGQLINSDGQPIALKPNRFPQSLRDHVWRETETLTRSYLRA